MISRLLKSEKGQSLVEFALIVPLLLTLLCGVIDFGWLYSNKYQVDHAAYSGVRYAVIKGSDMKDSEKNALINDTKTQVTDNLGAGAGSPTVTVTIDADDVTVNVKCEIKMLTFVGQLFIGQYYSADSTSIGARYSSKN